MQMNDRGFIYDILATTTKKPACSGEKTCFRLPCVPDCLIKNPVGIALHCVPERRKLFNLRHGAGTTAINKMALHTLKEQNPVQLQCRQPCAAMKFRGEMKYRVQKQPPKLTISKDDHFTTLGPSIFSILARKEIICIKIVFNKIYKTPI